MKQTFKFNDHHLTQWLMRNETEVSQSNLLIALTTVIQEAMYKNGDMSRGILVCDVLYPETIDLINEFYDPDLLIRLQDKVWRLYEYKLLHTIGDETNVRQQYRILCYGITNT